MRHDERAAAQVLAERILRALDFDIRIRSIELAILEHAHAALERQHVTRCDALAVGAVTCAGPIAAGWCRAEGCTFGVRRCELHGGGRAVGQALRHHANAHARQRAR